MSKKEKCEAANKTGTNKSKGFFYVFLSILSTVMIIMAILSFFLGESHYAISNGIIFIFATIAILLVFDSVESLSVGNVLSLKTKVREKEREVEKLNAENTQLRNQFISVIQTSLNNQSTNNLILNYSKDYKVEKADKKDSEEEEAIQEEAKQLSTETNKDEKVWNYQNRRAISARLEELLLTRFQEANGIADINLRKEVKITNIGIASDPIIEKDIVYDAYIKRPMDEIFIEVLSNMSSHALFDFRLYFMISRVYYYGQANKAKTKLIMLIPQFSESYIANRSEVLRFTPSRFVSRLKDMYLPAIQNELFEIVEIKITDEEMKHLEEETISQTNFNNCQ